jgi:hypothetical protein
MDLLVIPQCGSYEFYRIPTELPSRVANSKSPNGVHECPNGAYLGYIAGVHNFSEIGGLFEKTAEIKLEAWRRA